MIIHLRKIVIGIVIAALLALAPGMSAMVQAQSVQGIAATVNDQIISTYDLEQRMRLAVSSRQETPNEQALARMRVQLLDLMVNEALQIQESSRLGIQVSDAEVNQGLAQVARQNKMQPADLLVRIQSFGVDVETFRTQIRAELAWNKLIRSRFASRVRVGADEVDAVFSRTGGDEQGNLYRVGEIFIPVDAGNTDQQAKATMQQIVQRIREGSRFGDVAREYARATGSVRSGDIGWIAPGQLDPAIDSVLAKMKKGAIEGSIRTANGYSLVALIDKRGSGAQTGGSDDMVTLKQIVVRIAEGSSNGTDGSRSRAEAAASQLSTCDDVTKIENQYDAGSGHIGTVPLASLQPALRNAVNAVGSAGVTPPIKTEQGFTIIAVCGRTATEDSEKARARIEEGLMQQELGMMARRYMRDLRRDATVEVRQ